MLGKKLIYILPGVATLIGAILIYSWFSMKDRHPGYSIDLNIRNQKKGALTAGFAKVDITPLHFDTWNDVNGDSRYNKKDGDTFNDLNENGKFDAVWLAGFHQGRPANGVNDPLWARSMVLSDGSAKIGLCMIDMMGFGHDEVISTRKRIPPELGFDYVIIASTHVHSSPDLMGMWGPGILTRGTDDNYLEFVIEKIVESLTEADRAAKPSRLVFAQDLTSAESIVRDSRPPYVLDAGIRIMQAIDLATGDVSGTLLNWGNHPETLWSGNLQLTSDYPHYYRKYFEEGIYSGDSLLNRGTGGIAVFANGAIGGLMTTRPPDTIPHPISGDLLTGATFEKAEAQGLQLARISLQALTTGLTYSIDSASLKIRAKTIPLKMENRLFQLAGFLGIFRRGYLDPGHLRSEVAFWEIGDASFMHIPGELYPEILNGGVVSPDGSDFGVPPIETPPLRDLVPHTYKFMVGLSNDEIGYILPKSQWDTKAPYTFGRDKRPYGEVNSLGPETGPSIYRAIRELIAD